jgi:hypothetical protein
MSLRDTRNAPFCWQEKALLRQLRAYYSGDRLKRRTTAFAVYLVLTEIASDQYGQAQATAFVKEIGDRLGARDRPRRGGWVGGATHRGGGDRITWGAPATHRGGRPPPT